jgi:hypothetical protein
MGGPHLEAPGTSFIVLGVVFIVFRGRIAVCSKPGPASPSRRRRIVNVPVPRPRSPAVGQTVSRLRRVFVAREPATLAGLDAAHACANLTGQAKAAPVLPPQKATIDEAALPTAKSVAVPYVPSMAGACRAPATASRLSGSCRRPV